MATHSSIFAWRIPWTEEPGGLQSMGSQRVRHNWSDLAYTHRLRHLNANFHCSFNHNSQKGEITQVSIEWMDKKHVVSHSMVCYSVIEGNAILIPWTLKACKMKYARHKRTDTVWFCSSEVPGIVRFVETESRVPGSGGGKWRVIAWWAHRFCLGMIRRVLEIDSGDGNNIQKGLECHWFLCLKMMKTICLFSVN